jgi:D-erythritol 1-phosphate dehydrogenase
MPTPDRASDTTVDLLVVGGGINGAGIARDAAGRGLSVLLCEQRDLAQGTSSRSSRLIHGGLRYLEYGEFRLVREALREREVLLGIAPHLVRPMRFVLPHVAHMRAAWMLRAGLFLYDHLARRDRLPASTAVTFARVPEGAAVRPEIRRGFAYSDCRTDDARLVLANALDARRLGARIHTHMALYAVARGSDGAWRARLQDAQSGATLDCRARALVNAAGPWVEAVRPRIAGVSPKRRTVLVKGSHIIVPRFWQGEHAYILQNADRRVVFATPYEERYAMIGTTDIAYHDAPESAAITDAEIAYLCAAANGQLRCRLAPADVRHTFAGVRCLVDDQSDNPSAVTRDYVIDVDGEAPLDGKAGTAPCLTVLGGKITTFRRLAEHALDALRPWFPASGPAWSGTRPLPGGNLPEGDVEAAVSALQSEHTFLPPALARGLIGRHGSEAWTLLHGTSGLAGLGRHLGAGLYELEAHHFVENEWARSAEDILWRRTKYGLDFTDEQTRALERWVGERSG